MSTTRPIRSWLFWKHRSAGNLKNLNNSNIEVFEMFDPDIVLQLQPEQVDQGEKTKSGIQVSIGMGRSKTGRGF